MVALFKSAEALDHYAQREEAAAALESVASRFPKSAWGVRAQMRLAAMKGASAEAAEQYRAGGAADRADRELEEARFLQGYLPEQLSDEKVRELISGVIAEIGAQGLRDMGKVMAVLKERHPGQMDFAKASGVVKDLLK